MILVFISASVVPNNCSPHGRNVLGASQDEPCRNFNWDPHFRVEYLLGGQEHLVSGLITGISRVAI